MVWLLKIWWYENLITKLCEYLVININEINVSILFIIIEFSRNLIHPYFLQDFAMKTVSSVTYLVFIMVVMLLLLLIQTNGNVYQPEDYAFCANCVADGCRQTMWAIRCPQC